MPKFQPEEKGEGPGEASLAVRHQRVDAAVRIGVRRLKRQFPAGDVRELPVQVPTLVIEIVQALMREQVHEVEGLLLMARRRSGLSTCRNRSQQNLNGETKAKRSRKGSDEDARASRRWMYGRAHLRAPRRRQSESCYRWPRRSGRSRRCLQRR